MADSARLDVPADDEGASAGMIDEPRRWERVKEVFQSALELPAADRAGFIGRACAGDDALRREVESLLSAHHEAGTFAERTPLGPAMPVLHAGTQFGAYSVVERIGAGGMGEVYRARDTRLGRDVALKVLPRDFATEPDRVARLEREARVLAALNHPNIATIHGVEESNGARALVLELVEGPALADRLARGPIRVDEALRIAAQIAEALAAAHDKRIIHRDLKPANIKLTASGAVKVLDFGLAKPLTAGDPTTGFAALSTVEGALAGTPAYMSPEQARGQAVDQQSDIWAFGCVVYEMLAGRPPFTSTTITDTLAAVVEREPDWNALPQSTPAAVRRLLRRCLCKDRHDRLHAIADARLEIHDALAPLNDVPSPASGRTALPHRVAWTVSAVGLAAIGVLLPGIPAFRPAPAPTEATRFFESPPEGWALAAQSPGGPATNPLAVSPDGRHLAFTLHDATGIPRIWLRSLDRLSAREIEGTDGARSLFWSPDSRWLAFVAKGKLQRIAIAGGAPIPLCDCPSVRGGTWSRNDVILFFAGSPLLGRVSAKGGTPTDVTTLGTGETYNTRPYFLPDGLHFLYRSLLATATSNRGPIYVGSLDSDARTHVLNADSTNVVYSQGHLLYLRDNALVAQPFDADRLMVTGEPVQIADRIRTLGGLPFGFFSASENGVLAYQTGASAGGPQLTWIDRQGNTLERVGGRALYERMELSRDGTTAAVQMQTHGQEDIWLVDLQRNGNPRRFTFDTLPEEVPIWSPDGDQIAYRWDRDGNFLYVKSTRRSDAREVRLAIEGKNARPTSWSRDGKYLMYAATSNDGQNGLWVLPMSGDGKPYQFAAQPAAARFNGQFSPDGSLIAYVSNESGRPEVYVAPFDEREGRGIKISLNGGRWPRWRDDGKELFYVDGLPNQTKTLVAVDISRRGRGFHVGPVTTLFPLRWPEQAEYFYAPARDGRRFLVNVEPDIESDPPPITVIVNWLAGITKAVAP